MMKLISTVSIGSGGANSITFSNIPQDYADLYVVYSIRTTYAALTAGLGIIPNVHLPTPEYPNLEIGMYGNGSSAFTTTGAYRTIGVINGSTSTAGAFANGSIYIPNYSVSGIYKSITGDCVMENNATAASSTLHVVRTSTTNAITSFGLADGTSGENLAQYSSASLYGIIKGSGGASVA